MICEWEDPGITARASLLRFTVAAWAAVRVVEIPLMRGRLGR